MLRDSTSRYVGWLVGRSVPILFFIEFLIDFDRFFCEIHFWTFFFFEKIFTKKYIKNYQKLNKEQNDDRPTNRPTDQPTDIAAYRVA